MLKQFGTRKNATVRCLLAWVISAALLIGGAAALCPMEVRAEEDFSPLDRTETSSEEKKKTTLMIYLLGSTLEESSNGKCASKMIATELLAGGIDPTAANVLVYAGGSRIWWNGLSVEHNTLLKVEGNNARMVTMTVNDSNMAASGTLTDFINYSLENYPAEDYGLILWDHGGGSILGYGQDTKYEKIMSIPELKEAFDATPFGQGEKLAMLGMDACLMSTLENAAALEPYAERLVVSEESEWDPSWDYSVLGKLGNGHDLRSLPELIIDTFEDTFSQINSQKAVQFQTATLAELDLSGTGKVQDALDALSGKLNAHLAEGRYAEIEEHLNRVREIDDSNAGTETCWDLVDVKHFAQVFADLCPEEAAALSDAVDQMILHGTSNVENDNGLSMVLPRHSQQAGMMVKFMQDNLSIPNQYGGFLIMRETIAETGDIDYWKTHEPPVPVDKAKTTEPTPAETPEPTGTPEPTPTETPEPTPTETPEVSKEDAAVVVKLTDDEKKNVKTATYTIFQKMNDGFRPLLINMKASLTKDGEVVIPGDVRVLAARTDRSSGSFPWVAEQTAAAPDGGSFRIRTPMLVSGPEFNGVLDPDAIYLNAAVKTVPGSDDVQIINLSRLGDSNMSEMMPVDFTEWDGIAEFYPTYKEKRKGGKPVPFSLSDWEMNDSYIWRQLSYEDDFGFRMIPLSNLDGDYVCQVVVEDLFGKKTALELKDLNLTRAYTKQTVSVPGGSVTYRVYEDHAELTKCDDSVTSLEIPDSVGGQSVTKIATRACSENTSLVQAVIPAGVEEIGSDAFSGCTSLAEVSFAEGLLRVDSSAFKGCESLKELVLPDSVKYIGRAAFMDCAGLGTFKIPSSLETLSDGAFIGCSGIRLFTSDRSCAACDVRDGVVLSKDGKKLIAAPLFGVTYYRVPEGVEEIGYGVFASDHTLKRIDFPASLLRIGNYSFFDCPGLLGITLPEGLQSIGTSAFGRNLFQIGRQPLASIDTISIGPNVDYIGSNAFAGIRAKAFEVAEGNETFASSSGFLTNSTKEAIVEAPAGLAGTIEVPDGTISLKEQVFEILEDAETFVLPDSLAYIPEWAFPYKGIENGKHTYDITFKCSPTSAAAAYAKEYGIKTE